MGHVLSLLLWPTQLPTAGKYRCSRSSCLLFCTADPWILAFLWPISVDTCHVLLDQVFLEPQTDSSGTDISALSYSTSLHNSPVMLNLTIDTSLTSVGTKTLSAEILVLKSIELIVAINRKVSVNVIILRIKCSSNDHFKVDEKDEILSWQKQLQADLRRKN